MNDMKTIIRLLSAIRESENSPMFNLIFVSEETLRAKARDRDILAVKLQKAGLIEGLKIADEPRNKVIWEISEPEITLAGIEYLERINNAGQDNR